MAVTPNPLARTMPVSRVLMSMQPRSPYASSEPDGMPVPLDMAEPGRRGVRVRAVVDREGLSFHGRAGGLGDLAVQGVQIRVGTDLTTKLITVDRWVTLLPPMDAADRRPPPWW
ncbi:hypothetical protein ACIQEY_26635 [Streptomyces parvus]|uniref:hypothetical protein n=1 Tax=Streptomyces parvus TaxID=66428 RepID=UPI0037F4C0B7